MRIRDTESFWPWIRDKKKIRIPDPQHFLRSCTNWETSCRTVRYSTVPSADTKHKTCLLFLHHLGVGCSGGDAVLHREAGSRDAIVGGFGLLVSTAGGFGLLGSAAAAAVGKVSLLTTVRWWWLLSEPFDREDFCIRANSQKILFLYIFCGLECVGHSYAYVAHFFIFERCLDSNTESCLCKQVRYQLSHSSPD